MYQQHGDTVLSVCNIKMIRYHRTLQVGRDLQKLTSSALISAGLMRLGCPGLCQVES